MGESHHHQATTSRLGARTTGGEIVEVQGGHIVRSTGRKDRHCKVCTAKGPRDRRVRLSAHTAIQFYDVQDRLGYDRPSKAVDWLIKKAKAAIDELAELPAWTPTAVATTKTSTQQDHHPIKDLAVPGGSANCKTAKEATTMTALGSVQNVEQQQLQHLAENPNNNSSFLPPSLDSDAIADTIKSFFPIGAAVETSSSSAQFQSYPPDLLSRTSSQSQDLRLSLQSFQEPILLQQQQQQQQPHHGHAQNQQQVLFSGTPHHHHLGFDGPSAGWSEHHQHQSAEIRKNQRMSTWKAGGAADTGFGGGGRELILNATLLQTVSPPPLLQPLFGQNQLFSQRGPLQSSNMPSFRAWIDPAITSDHHLHHHNEIPQIHQQQDTTAGIGFAAPIGGFSGYPVPARIQAQEEEHDGIYYKPTSASSDSRH